MNQPPPAAATATSDGFATASGCCMTGMLFGFAFFALVSLGIVAFVADGVALVFDCAALVFDGAALVFDGVALVFDGVSFDCVVFDCVALVSFDVVLDGVVLDLSASNATLTASANVFASFAFGIGFVL